MRKRRKPPRWLTFRHNPRHFLVPLKRSQLLSFCGCFLLLAALLSQGQILAQAAPAAQRQIDLTIFAGATRTYTGLSMGHNGSFTGGLDLNLPETVRLRPSLEVRTTIPFSDGLVISQQSVLAGGRVEARFGAAHPYIDFLAGPGKIRFVRPYSTYSGQPIYSQPDTTVLSPGLGIRFDLSPRFSVFGDAQLQRWGTPASLSGHLFAKPFTAGIVFRLPLTSARVR